MGQKLNVEVIDDTFSGLLEPNAIHEVGGEGIVDRPGKILLEAVNSFGREGFRQLAKAREAERAAAEQVDASVKKDTIVDLGLKLKSNENGIEIKKSTD